MNKQLPCFLTQHALKMDRMYCASAKSETAAGATGWLVVTFTAEGNRRKPSSWNYEFRRCAMETSLVSLVGHGDLDAVKRHLDQIRRTHGQAGFLLCCRNHHCAQV